MGFEGAVLPLKLGFEPAGDGADVLRGRLRDTRRRHLTRFELGGHAFPYFAVFRESLRIRIRREVDAARGDFLVMAGVTIGADEGAQVGLIGERRRSPSGESQYRRQSTKVPDHSSIVMQRLASSMVCQFLSRSLTAFRCGG